MMNWRPIETAPKDGTRVLVYAPGHLHMIAAWIEHHGYTYLGPAWFSNNSTILPPPTHWMPLPEFPARDVDAGPTLAEKKAQAARCPCHGSDDYCPCQNRADATTIALRAALEAKSHDD
jgi:hypothetical protein